MLSGSSVVRLVALLACLWLDTDAYDWTVQTALDQYVQAHDSHYGWNYLTQYSYADCEIYIVNMTSQKWQDETFTTRSIWWHIMGIAIPNTIRYTDAGFLMIEGGDNDMDPPIPGKFHIVNMMIRRIAEDTGIIGGYILQVPNQPEVFSNDPTQESRSEDEIIAWTWRTYLDDPTPDSTVIARMPMTKAAKQGLDTVHAVGKQYVPSTHIDKFVVYGASKRGWTTWSIACTDQRVVGLVPMVFSLLNMPMTVQNHYQDLGGAWSFAFEPYYKENLTQDFMNPKIDGVYDVEDMYRYRERLAGTPKLLISASGDEFFLCDENHFWWNDMPDPKWLLMVQNAEHILAPHYPMIAETMVSFILSIFDQVPLPTVTWTMSETAMAGAIIMTASPDPVNITAWTATTLVEDSRRDFRLFAIQSDGQPGLHPVTWNKDTEVVDLGNGQYSVTVQKVDGEWTGFFIQGTWDGPAPYYYRLMLTTQVNVIPDTYPVGPCTDPVSCYGYLI